MPLAKAIFHNIKTLCCYTTCDLHVCLLDWLMFVNLKQARVIREEEPQLTKCLPEIQL